MGSDVGVWASACQPRAEHFPHADVCQRFALDLRASVRGLCVAGELLGMWLMLPAEVMLN